MKRALLLATLIVMAPHAHDAHAYKLIGLGVISCGKWTSSRRSHDDFAPKQWMLGFLSGIGFVHSNGDDPLDNMDGEGVLAWIDNFCQTHPITPLDEAAAAFYFEHPH